CLCLLCRFPWHRKLSLIEELLNECIREDAFGIKFLSDLAKLVVGVRVHCFDFAALEREMFSPMRSSTEILHDGFNPRVNLIRVWLGTHTDVAHVSASGRTQQAMVCRHKSDFNRQRG